MDALRGSQGPSGIGPYQSVGSVEVVREILLLGEIEQEISVQRQ